VFVGRDCRFKHFVLTLLEEHSSRRYSGGT